MTESRAGNFGLISECRAGELGFMTEGCSGEEGAARHEGFGLFDFLPYATPPLAPRKSAWSPNSNPENSISSLGALEKSIPAKVTRTPLFACRHLFHSSLPFAARPRKMF
jgi:hypothetical protein